ncbi:UNVERIFIED_CONTAM: G-type lectin S-receptor-like serine/threonine-protein kinase [Sesamum calycinum]|uniref:G-type lectin S-receptor-like serine/threonine-protein kinase n=1 Tax=Sesamum calycinum TaxID=2727403 RepID=A0AAW2KPB9_9LAMI
MHNQDTNNSQSSIFLIGKWNIFQLTTTLCQLLLSIILLKFSVAVDTLFPNQTITIGQTLVSQSQVFEMGFFSPGRSGNIYLGIWDGSVVWSVNSSGLASNPILQLLDTGNLVLVDGKIESSLQGYIWQSFDYPTDTWLPGMKMIDDIDAGVEKYLISWKDWDDPSPGDFIFKIENQGLPQLVMFRGRMKRFRSGQWNGIHCSGAPPFPNPIFKPDMSFKGEKLISMSDPYDSSIFKRVTLDKSGLLYINIMNARKDKWNVATVVPRDPCDEYNQCGPYGICGINRPIRCKRVKYPDMLQFWLNSSMSLSECKAECLRNCNCTAYANPYITSGGSGCLIWLGNLIDTKVVNEADSKQSIYIRVSASEVSEAEISTDLEKEKEKKRPIKLMLISMVSGVLVSGFINGAILLMTRRKMRAPKNEDLELPVFKWTTIVAATNDFSRENIIGEGGQLVSEEEIAVKRLSRTSGQGLEEFKTEVILIAKLQHRNLVRLLGCCIEGEERMLIYEYLPNKSLDRFVFGLAYEILHPVVLLVNFLNFLFKCLITSGYMAPEYAMDGKFSVKSDIFSMGVVLLEIVSGQKNRGFDHCTHCHSLLEHAWLLWKENNILELMDECLNDTFCGI